MSDPKGKIFGHYAKRQTLAEAIYIEAVANRLLQVNRPSNANLELLARWCIDAAESFYTAERKKREFEDVRS